MPNQSAKFISAVFAGVLAGASFAPALIDSAHADDNCLAAPKGEQTPQGSHWYYHIERGTKRHCWYLREEGDTHAQSAAAASDPAPAKPAPPKADAAMQGSVADARAELPWPQQPAAEPSPAPNGQAPTAAVADAAARDGSPPPASAVAGANMLQTTVASRWPDQLGSRASGDSAPQADHADASAQPDEASVSPADAATVPLATADVPPSGKRPGSIQMLLTVMVAALALAGIIAGAILRFGGRKPDDDQQADVGRRPTWRTDGGDGSSPYSAAPAHRSNIGLPRELRTEEADDKVAEMLARLARSAQT